MRMISWFPIAGRITAPVTLDNSIEVSNWEEAAE